MRKGRKNKLWMENISMFLKQVRIVKLFLAAGVAALISVFWYVNRFGEAFSTIYDFSGLDSIFFICGNYPKGMEAGLMPDHYLMAMLPFILLAEHLISYVDTNTCERIFYICLRRKKLWKQAGHDLVRILFIVFAWMACYQAVLGTVLGCLYGWSGVSYFVERSLAVGDTVNLLCLFTLRQMFILFSVAMIIYGIQLWLGGSWSAIVMIGMVSAMVLMVFSGADFPFLLNLRSFRLAEPLLLLILILAGIVFLRKYLWKIYLHE